MSSSALDLDDPLEVRAPADRPNLRFWAIECANERARAREVLRMVLSMADSPGIIYTGRRATSEEVAGLLRSAGISARHYHAGLVPEQREAIQDDFFSDNTRVIVATKAFGMGINKPNIGWVIHYDLPESLDNYAQEAGRAARDRTMVGECVLLFTKQDIARRLKQSGKSTAHASTQLAKRLLAVAGGLPDRAATRSCSIPRRWPTSSRPRRTRSTSRWRGWSESAWSSGCWTARPGAWCLEACASPSDAADRRRFIELFTTTVRTTPEKASQIDFARLEDEHGLDPDDLERDLVRWSLDRFVTFSSTRRNWRVRLTGEPLDEADYERGIESFRVWGQRRLKRMIDYGRTTRCRRIAISEHFGDPGSTCLESATQACDVCSSTAPPWASLPDYEVPDPETIVDVDLIVLKAVTWASRFKGGRYGEVGPPLRSPRQRGARQRATDRRRAPELPPVRGAALRPGLPAPIRRSRHPVDRPKASSIERPPLTPPGAPIPRSKPAELGLAAVGAPVMTDAVVEKEISEDLLESAIVSFGPKEQESLGLPEHSGEVVLDLDGDEVRATWNARSRHLTGEALADRLQEFAQVGWLIRFSRLGDRHSSHDRRTVRQHPRAPIATDLDHHRRLRLALRSKPIAEPDPPPRATGSSVTRSISGPVRSVSTARASRS